MADNKPAVIRVHGLNKRFNGFDHPIDILKDVDFTVFAGETVAVVGESGIGKSTLLNILGTLDAPDEGTIIINGETVSGMSDDKLAAFRNRSMGFVFQFHYLLPEFSALENVMMPALIYGTKKKEAEEKAMGLLDRTGLTHRISHRPGELSGGEKQRVAIARALVMEPAVVLADEPTGNLDENNSEKVHDLLLEINEERKTALLVVTHNPQLASLMKRRVTIKEGKLLET